MTHMQKLLALFIAAEVVGLAVLGALYLSARPRPRANLSRFHPSVRPEMRQLEELLGGGKVEQWLELADSYRAFGLFPEAEYCFRQGHELSPPDPKYLYLWGVTLDRLGRMDEARERYRQAIQRGFQDKPQCWLRIAQGYLRQEDPQPAEKAFRQALDLPQARLFFARHLIHAGRADEARHLLVELLRSQPNDLRGHQLRSWAEAALGNDGLAAEFQDRALRGGEDIPPGDAITGRIDRQRLWDIGIDRLHLRSIDLHAKGDRPGALAASRQAAELKWTPGSIQQLALLELESGRPRRAIELLEELAQRFGFDAASLDLLGDALERQGQHDRARDVWLKAARFYPSVNLHQKLAGAFHRDQQPPQAQRHEGLRLYALGREAWLKNDLATAQKHLTAATHLIADHAHAWFYLAETHRLRGQNAAAQAAYDHCLEANPHHGRALRGKRLTK